MTYQKLLCAGLLALSLSACVGDGLTRGETSNWLDAKAGTVSTNVGGKWTTSGGPGANWGEATLVQDGSRFYGTLGAYSVDGAINREHIYLVLIADKTVRYTANLRRGADGNYAGKVVENGIVDHPAYPDVSFSLLNLRRVGN
jgi:hypothetical protein